MIMWNLFRNKKKVDLENLKSQLEEMTEQKKFWEEKSKKLIDDIEYWKSEFEKLTNHTPTSDSKFAKKLNNGVQKKW